jgi:5-deoxy-D-glucuronate isomerase
MRAVNNDECLKAQNGYHPVGAPVGYDRCYLDLMTGPTRPWLFRGVRSDA